MQRNSVNKVILVGHVGQDPVQRFTQSGTAITNVSIATNESWKNQNGELQDRTEWHRIVLYGKMAETANDFLKRGQQVYVEGRLATNEWTDNNDIKRKTTEVRCDMFTMLGKKVKVGAILIKRLQINPSKTVTKLILKLWMMTMMTFLFKT